MTNSHQALKAALFALLVTPLIAPVVTTAQTSTAITYQGQLQDGGGPFDGTPGMEFRLYDSLTDGNQIGNAEFFSGVPVEDGLFQVELDFGAGAFDGSERYLEIEVAGTTLEPRQRVASMPVAQFALDGKMIGPQGPQGRSRPARPPGRSRPARAPGARPARKGPHRPAPQTGPQGPQGETRAPGREGPQGSPGEPGDSPWTVNGSMTYYNAGNVGIGTGSPGAPLHVETASANDLVFNPALYARTTSSVDFFTVGVQGESSGASGRGVFGRATSTSGGTYGVHGESASSSGRGVVGSATASSGTTYGVKGEVSSPDGYAGHFTGGRSYFGEKVGIGTTSPDSRLHVVHDSSSDSAIHGESSGAGSGVSGHNTQTSGIRSGVFGRSDASAGRGVQGLATASSGNNAGVLGQSNSSNGG